MPISLATNSLKTHLKTYTQHYCITYTFNTTGIGKIRNVNFPIGGGADCEPDGDVDWADLAALADFSGDGLVDFEDLARLSDYWLQDEPPIDIAPAGGDGTINFLDFAKFAEARN